MSHQRDFHRLGRSKPGHTIGSVGTNFADPGAHEKTSPLSTVTSLSRPEAHAWLTAAQVAAAVQVTVRTVRTWIASGELPAFRIGRRIRISVEDLRAFAQRHRVRKLPSKL